jgi:hypothetical protein
MNPDEYEIVGEHFRWIRATSEIEDSRNESRRPDSDYTAKVDVYEDRVLYWFLDIAKGHVANGTAAGDYVPLSIALAYVEGSEQYRQGKRTPQKQSAVWFKAGLRRIFPKAPPAAVDRLWDAVRNGLFHDGFTRDPTLLSHGQPGVVGIVGRYLIINPATFVGGVLRDFDAYVRLLRDKPSGTAAVNFRKLWDQQWDATSPNQALHPTPAVEIVSRRG